jgi:hypothetical protein
MNESERIKVLCPWHAERTPSCLGDLKAGTYYCLGCRKHGPLSELMHALSLRGETFERFFDGGEGAPE